MMKRKAGGDGSLLWEKRMEMTGNGFLFRTMSAL